MKKNLLVAFLVLSSLTSLANARFFLGIDGGYSMDRVDVEKKIINDSARGVDIQSSLTKNAYLGNGYLFNINLGTEHHFDENNYVGFRWFLSGGYGRTNLINQSDKTIKYPSGITDFKLGLDLLLDVIKFGNNSLGLFGGVEGGVNIIYSDDYFLNKNGATVPVLSSTTPIASARIGISLFLFKHHRIDIMSKIPFFTVNLGANGSNDSPHIYKPIQFMLGYKFVF